MFMKLAPASVATAFASIVLPVPGGPKSNIPLHGWHNYNKKIVSYLPTSLENIASTIPEQKKD